MKFPPKFGFRTLRNRKKRFSPYTRPPREAPPELHNPRFTPVFLISGNYHRKSRFWEGGSGGGRFPAPPCFGPLFGNTGFWKMVKIRRAKNRVFGVFVPFFDQIWGSFRLFFDRNLVVFWTPRKRVVFSCFRGGRKITNLGKNALF